MQVRGSVWERMSIGDGLWCVSELFNITISRCKLLPGRVGWGVGWLWLLL